MASAQLTEVPSGVPPRPGDRDPHIGEPNRDQRRGGGAARKIIVLLVTLAVVGGVVWKIRSNKTTQTNTANRMNAASDRPQPVLIAPVVQKTMPIYLTALGTVTPYNSVTVKSRVDGQLLSVNVREGQSVRKGQLLAEIDSRPYEAALAQAQGQLVKDQANSRNAEAQAARYTALLDAGVVSRESQQSQVSTAGQVAGSLAVDQAAIQAARVNVTYTRITSPIDGIVGLRQVDPGNIVHASDATGLLLVTQLQPISVIFTLPEDQLPEVLRRVRSGQKLAVQAYDRSESARLADGTVLTLDNQIDPTTGTDKVKAVFPNKDGALFPNQFVNIRLVLQQRPDAIVVPASAIQTGSQGTFVFVVKQGMPPNAGPGAGGGSGRRGAGGSAGGAGNAGGPASAAATGAGGVTVGTAGTGSPVPTGRSPGGNRAGGPGQGGGSGPPFYVVQQPVTVDITEGSQVILASGVRPGDQVVVDGQERLLPYSRVVPRTQDQVPGGAGRGSAANSGTAQDASPGVGGPAAAANSGASSTAGPGARGRPASAGPSTAAFGPGGAGAPESRSNPGKQGIETGPGIHPGDAAPRQGGNGRPHHPGAPPQP